jgi:RNA polymerase sigma-70 factor, ECF subfamily
LARISQRDRASFEELHRRLSSLLFTSALGVLGNREAAEDVTQDVFLQIWEKAPTYDPARGKAATWALTLTRNKAIDRLRAVHRRQRLNESFEEQGKTAQNFDDRDSLVDALRGERGAAVRSALALLSPDQREAIQLAYFDDMPYPQVARIVGAPLGTVKARIRRGMMRMRELLEGEL